MSNVVFATAHELATGIRQRQVSATEVLEAYLAQIARHNPALNAIVTLDEERAWTRAQEADAALARSEVWGPLHGVPVTIKDSFATAGVRTTCGFPPLAGHVPSTDATVVARLRAAGGILLGKTNLPPLAGGFQCDNPLFGRTNNPWDLGRTPGGSTGGGAAALAAGLSPLEMGSDYGGSIRIPAHYCGVYGLKPTEHVVSTAGHMPRPQEVPRGVRHMAGCGPLARSVQDLALALQVIAGPDLRQPEVPPVLLPPASARPWQTLRVAWTDDFGGVPVSGDTRAALARLAGALQQQGCQVERGMPQGFDFPTVWEILDQRGHLNSSHAWHERKCPRWSITQRYIDEAGLAGRVHVLTADAVEGPLSGAYDVAVLFRLLQVLSPDQACRVLRNVSQVIEPGGVIYIIGQVLDNSRLSPPETVAGNLFFLNVFDEGQAYTEHEHRDWLAGAGFAQCERLLLPNKMSIVSARKPT